ncbi:hypothetical protein [Devosia beringensis]|uniref:hypothetical protein n=1 Tax=Devosia beringensis TaxID=2657486 RepID=UPI00186B5B80|nr:hypothetical protein [Devosia beringensis]
MFRSAIVALLTIVALQPALAQESVPKAGLALELNALQPADAGCRVTFLATNSLPGQLDRTAVEIAFFLQDGGIDRIVTLDFKALSPGKTKVLQFELAGLACPDLGRLLINDITACEGTGIVPATCLDNLVTTSRPDITFGI